MWKTVWCFFLWWKIILNNPKPKDNYNRDTLIFKTVSTDKSLWDSFLSEQTLLYLFNSHALNKLSQWIVFYWLISWEAHEIKTGKKMLVSFHLDIHVFLPKWKIKGMLLIFCIHQMEIDQGFVLAWRFSHSHWRRAEC